MIGSSFMYHVKGAGVGLRWNRGGVKGVHKLLSMESLGGCLVSYKMLSM